jgi:hypothetical protein
MRSKPPVETESGTQQQIPHRRLAFECLAVALGSTGLGLVFSYPLLTNLSIPSALDDWDHDLAYSWAPYDAIRNFHQFPLWNPYKCGGLPLFANPESRIATPFTLLHLLAGPIAGLYLDIPMHFALAWAGGYLLARALKMSRLAACGAATVFPASSWYALHMTAGHSTFLAMTFMPWVLAFCLLAGDRHRLSLAACAAAAFALSFLDGYPYEIVFELLLIAVVLPGYAIRGRSLWPMWALGVTVVLGAGLMAVKLVPVSYFMATHPRLIVTGDPLFDQNDYQLLRTVLFSRNQDHSLFSTNDNWGYWEFGGYIGLFGLPAILGAFCGAESLIWILTGAWLLLVWRGSPSPFWPWPLLHYLPVLSQTRVPSRAIVPFTLVVGVLAGFGFDWVGHRVQQYGRAIAASVMLIATIDCLVVGTPNYWYVVGNPESEIEPLASGFHQIFRTVPKHELSYARNGEGAKHCNEITRWPTRVLGYDQRGYKGEQYLTGQGSVELARWTPNALEYEVDAPEATVLVVNQNYDPYWRIAEGTGQVFELDGDVGRTIPVPGLLAVRVPAGHHVVSLVYRSTPVIVGAIVSLLSVLAGLILWRLEARSHTQDEVQRESKLLVEGR